MDAMSSILKMEAVYEYETAVPVHETVRYRYPEAHHFDSHLRKSLHSTLVFLYIGKVLSFRRRWN